MKDARKGIVVAGSLIADVFYEIDTYPDQGMLTNIRDTSRNVGGSGNLILDLAKLDEHLPVEVCAIVGCDENGDYLLEELSKYDNIEKENIPEVSVKVGVTETVSETIKEEVSSDGIIDSLFAQKEITGVEDIVESNPVEEHVVDPDDFALYKKYLG